MTSTSHRCEPRASRRNTPSCTTSEARLPNCGARGTPWQGRSSEPGAETAFLHYPTPENPNHYHIYQGTQRSGTITQEDIPSWWVVLALVLREEGTDGGPNQHLTKKTKQHQTQQAKRGGQATKPNNTRRVKKTIQKWQNAARSQSNSAAQRRRALQAITQATAKGRPADKPKKQRATYKTASQNEQAHQRLLALTAPGPIQTYAIEDDSDPMQQDPERHNNQPTKDHNKERYSTHLEDQSLQASPPKAPRYDEPVLQAVPRYPHPPTAQRQPPDKQACTTTQPAGEARGQATNGRQLPVPPGTTPTDGEPPAPARAPPRPPADGPSERESGGPTHRYGLITLFDGCSSTHDLITEAVGSQPTVCIAAENDTEVRRYVACGHWRQDTARMNHTKLGTLPCTIAPRAVTIDVCNQCGLRRAH